MADTPKKPDGNASKLGTFAGVFTPSVLTILGIILFLRLGYVVGSVGLMQALAIIALANVISVLTAFSVAAIATTIRVKAGGVYYMISRTLGLGYGGAIGLVLFLAQSISVGFYCIGFAEGTAALFPAGEFPLVQPLAAIAILVLFVFAWLGADWATKLQYVIMALLFIAIGVFAFGGVAAWDTGQLRDNWSVPNSGSFWVAFAVFFPAVTGFTQGVNMSGDLAQPSKSIPIGTFWAVGLSAVIYFGGAVLFAATLPADHLATDYGAMKTIAVYAPLIDAGLIAATLSSALSSFLGAPRILQALARDRVFPVLSPLAHGSGPMNNPRRAVLVTAAIALGVVAVGNLNLVASVVSMFFLVSYGLLNYATYFEARAASPSFRPTFRLYHHRLSLLGGLGCLGVMIAIDPAAGIAAVAIVFAIYQYLAFRAVPARWSDSRRSYHLQKVREHLLAAAAQPEHPRDWRPQLLVMSDNAERRKRLLRFASWLEGGAGLSTVVQIIEDSGSGLVTRRQEASDGLAAELKAHDATAFPLVVQADSLDAAIPVIIQSAGTGPIRVNTVMANSPRFPSERYGELFTARYDAHVRTAFGLGCNLTILDADEDDWRAVENTDAEDKVIDVWWIDNPTGQLMLIFAHLMTRDTHWEGARIRVLVDRKEWADPETQQADLQAMLDEVRVDAEPTVVDGRGVEGLAAMSRESTIVMIPLSLHSGRLFHGLGREVEEFLPDLPMVLLTLAAQDVDLNAEPEEGKVAESARARDVRERADARLQRFEKKAAATIKDAERAEKQLADAVADGADSAALEGLRADLEERSESALRAKRMVTRATAFKKLVEERAATDPAAAGVKTTQTENGEASK